MIYRPRGILIMGFVSVSYSFPHYGYTAHPLEDTLRCWSDAVNLIYFHEFMSSVLCSWRRFSKPYQMGLEEDGANFRLLL